MKAAKSRGSAPGFVVFREVRKGLWELLGETARHPGLTARAARSRTIVEAAGGTARATERYAAVLRSEWRVACDWQPKPDRRARARR